MDSILQLDPESLANLSRRMGAGELDLAEGRLTFTYAGRRVEVSALTVSGRVRIDGMAVDLREVRPTAAGVSIAFAVLPPGQ